MKKPIALLLAAAMTAGLSACGGSSEPAGTQAPASSAAGGETKEAQAPAAEVLAAGRRQPQRQDTGNPGHRKTEESSGSTCLTGTTV